MNFKNQIDKTFKFIIIYWFILAFVYFSYAFGVAVEFSYSIYYGLIVFYSFIIFVFITLIISWIKMHKIIKLADEMNKPIPKKIKIKMFLSPLISSFFAWVKFDLVGEWDYSKFKMNDPNKVFLEAKYQYLPNENLTKELSNSKWFKYLQKKFETVSVVWIDDYSERYRIGSLDENAIFGKDFIILERNKNYSAVENAVAWENITTSPAFCLYALVQKGNKKSIIRTIKLFSGNIYMKFGSFKGMVFWIRLHFKQFKRIKK